MSARRILLLGSGLVARPCVDYLARNESNHLTIACRTLESAQKLAIGFSNCTAIVLDVTSIPALEAQVAAHELVISLVPFSYHADVIKAACKSRTNVVTTSYVSAAIKALEEEVKAAGIVVMNEAGVDPGVDHLYAIKFIDEVHSQHGKVKEFYSYCGGVPAPENANNPLGFKFSWSPRGALLSQCNSASFIQHGRQVDIPADMLMSVAHPYHVLDGYSFVAYPNRDSVPFRDFYRIPEADTVVRGSLRYAGNPALVKTLATLGWLDSAPKSWLKEGLTWAEVMQTAIGASSAGKNDLKHRVVELCGFVSQEESERIISGLEWFGLFSDKPATLRQNNLLDTLCAQLEKLLSYQPGERDLVMLQHKFVVEWANGKMDTVTSTLELLGDPDGYSAMARSVGVTCGIASQLVLDQHVAFSKPGILAPYTSEICTPMRERLEAEGIKMVERVL